MQFICEDKDIAGMSHALVFQCFPWFACNNGKFCLNQESEAIHMRVSVSLCHYVSLPAFKQTH